MEYYKSIGDAVSIIGIGILTAVIGMMLIHTIILVVGHANLFTKAGRPWWEAIVPILNSWRISEIAFGAKYGWTSLLILGLYIVPVIGTLAAAVLQCYRSYKYALAYNSSKGLAVCYVLFTPIILIYWLIPDTCKYVGNEENIFSRLSKENNS